MSPVSGMLSCDLMGIVTEAGTFPLNLGARVIGKDIGGLVSTFAVSPFSLVQ